MQRYSNMSNYTVIRSNDHLAHYGVLGMKWGVRHNYITKNGSMQNIHRQKKGIISGINYIGFSRRANKASRKAYKNERKARTARTKFGRHIRTVRGKNLRSSADLYKKWAEEGTGYFDRLGDVLSKPTTTIAGRESTAGKEYIASMLTGGLYGTVNDIKYLRDKRQAS